jgi:hypothetical protein
MEFPQTFLQKMVSRDFHSRRLFAEMSHCVCKKNDSYGLIAEIQNLNLPVAKRSLEIGLQNSHNLIHIAGAFS